MKRKIAILMSVLMLAGLAACGKKEAPTTTSSKTTSGSTSTQSETKKTKSNEIDYSSPSIVVEFGDGKAMQDLGKKMQNFELEEGTVVKITGIASKMSGLSIMEKVEGGKYGMGIVFTDGEAPKVKDDTKIEIVGVVVKGKFAMELHAPLANLKILE